MTSTLAKSVIHLRRLCAPKPLAQRVDMSGRNVIVTGASPRSIGYETARILAGWGARVVATGVRNVELAESCLKNDLRRMGADENRITVHPLDLCDVDSVAGFAAWYQRRHEGILHVLVNNAGTHKNVLSPQRKPPLTRDGLEVHWRTNYLGTFHLTHLLLPCLKQSGLESGDARVVTVSSHLHDRANNRDLFRDGEGYNSWDAYGLSKLALVHFAFEIDRRFAQAYNLRSVALHPGSVYTNITRMAILEGKFGFSAGRTGFALASLLLLHPKFGAQTVVMCASKSPLQGGSYYEHCKIAQPSVQCRQQSVSRELWDRSADWVETLAKPRSE
ncbi:MAG: SDR family NAD(P)-dependent oxidoreductase [Acidobacteria bacterium]|nr:SDR family NAD(P)-dependent oxidoreductase [Acidobacteriota bacterium]